MTEQRATNRQIACFHEAGHFVLCWYFGLPPMTVTTTARGHGKTKSTKPFPIAPSKWKICLMGGYAAEMLLMPPEKFLAITNGFSGALQQPDRVDTKIVTMQCKTPSEYNGAYITAHYLLKHYEEQFVDALRILFTNYCIKKTDADNLYEQWQGVDKSYYPTKEEINQSKRNVRKEIKLIEQSRQKAKGNKDDAES